MLISSFLMSCQVTVDSFCVCFCLNGERIFANGIRFDLARTSDLLHFGLTIERKTLAARYV